MLRVSSGFTDHLYEALHKSCFNWGACWRGALRQGCCGKALAVKARTRSGALCCGRPARLRLMQATDLRLSQQASQWDNVSWERRARPTCLLAGSQVQGGGGGDMNRPCALGNCGQLPSAHETPAGPFVHTFLKAKDNFSPDFKYEDRVS